MHLDSLPRDHVIHVACTLCRKHGSFTVAELIRAFGPSTLVEDLTRRFYQCCRTTPKVNSGVT